MWAQTAPNVLTLSPVAIAKRCRGPAWRRRGRDPCAGKMQTERVRDRGNAIRREVCRDRAPGVHRGWLPSRQHRRPPSESPHAHVEPYLPMRLGHVRQCHGTCPRVRPRCAVQIMKNPPAVECRRVLRGADGNRNHDLFDANEALYQLSYSPLECCLASQDNSQQYTACRAIMQFRAGDARHRRVSPGIGVGPTSVDVRSARGARRARCARCARHDARPCACDAQRSALRPWCRRRRRRPPRQPAPSCRTSPCTGR